MRPIRWVTLAAFLVFPWWASAEPSAGLWFSPDRNGHGFDLQPVGDQYVVVFYSYDAAGEPLWYLATANWIDGRLEGQLDRYRYDPTTSPPQQLADQAGAFVLDFAPATEGSACSGSAATERAEFAWTLEGESSSWCVQPLLRQDEQRREDFTGLWFAGSDDVGWGLTLDFAAPAQTKGTLAAPEVGVLFYYDQTGFPRWALGVNQMGAANSTIILETFEGYCRTCPMIDLRASPAGTLTHELSVAEGVVAGAVDMAIEYPLEPGGTWNRTDSPLVPLSDPQPGLRPLPEELANTQSILLTGATLVPMTDGFPLRANYDLLVENGLIAALAPAGEIEVGSDVVRVDARRLYVAPGMSEMHLHITVGGRQAAEEAGLLMIANGVTTALNMGSTILINVPELAEKFASGELIGPTFYSGQVAYGRDDDASTVNTVQTPAEATDYAERLHLEGFDFIKVYWRLLPEVIEQFFVESERLGLPIIGHIPLTQPMRRSLGDGHRMAAHIQEPYVTQMGSVRDARLLPAVSQVFLDNGTYLTPTLAVFESYILIAGNNEANFETLIARDGEQFQPPSIKATWRNYFQTRFVQQADQEDLLDLLAFYKVMTKAFFDAGVPLLTGTDAPGFPGVMSGFGVLEEMRLLHEVGIPADEVFAITTRNAGAFIDDTLAPPVSFGTLEVGKRADLLLLSRNPLESIDHARRPEAVLARGQFWSQVYLDQALEALRSSIKRRPASSSRELPFCRHDDWKTR
ncbi:MAG: amidohydrolase family protein [Pseudomonadota bacterium]